MSLTPEFDEDLEIVLTYAQIVRACREHGVLASDVPSQEMTLRDLRDFLGY